MSQSTSRSFSPNVRQIFLRGLVILLPSVLTLWIVVKAYQFVDNTIAEPINRSVRLAMVHSATFMPKLRQDFDPTDEAIQTRLTEMAATDRTENAINAVRTTLRTESINLWWTEHWYLDLIGLAVAISAVYVAGRLLGGFFGRRIYRRVEALITQLPVVKQVYPYVKQIVDFLFSDEQPIKINRVVVVEYPRKGIWSVGFLTGDTMRAITEQSGDSVTIFIPSSPTPFTGYTITVPRSEVRDLPISVDEAIRFAVSGGVLIPDHQSITTEGERPELIPLTSQALAAEADEPESKDADDTQAHRAPEEDEPRHRDAV